MMARGDGWSPGIENSVHSSPTADSAAAPGRRSGIVSTTIRATPVLLLLYFDLFPRLVGRSFLMIGAVLVVLLGFHELLRPTSRARVVVFWVLLTFGILAAPGVLRPPETEYGQEKLLFLVTLTLLSAAAVALIRGRRDVEMFAAMFVVCGVVLALAALAAGSPDGRSQGFGANPIWLGRATGAAVVAVAWLYYRKRLSGWWAAALALILALGLFATGSRGPMVATVVALLVLALAGLRQKVGRGRREWIGVGLMAGLAATFVAFPSLLPPRMYALLVDPSDELELSVRPEMQKATLPIIAEHPAGVGFGNWAHYSGMLKHDYPHNLWLELTAEAGWLVGGALILAVTVVAVGLWRAARVDAVAGFALALLAFNVVAVSTSGDINGNRALFSSLALGLLVLTGATLDRGGDRRGRVPDDHRRLPVGGVLRESGWAGTARGVGGEYTRR
ncbi:O-antigen ligase [Micromonospora rhizosphaerae]|uniref:O-antigen ligase n=1 Tax=Micromonospora rhizosphaerae TaxID=568872 RepID=A0A1C6S3B9_9ACTN|nr:O-antigen ligase family protein [Micromonospora rhizosphaerae]SCL23990.1 O-antigen ligase [Micromonospora rhizosphaerae]